MTARREVVLARVATLCSLSAQIRRLERELAGVLHQHPDGAIFRSLFKSPYSTITAATLLAEIGDCRARYPTRDALASDAGQAAVAGESGKRKVAGFRSACNKRLRSAFDTLADSTRHCPRGPPTTMPAPSSAATTTRARLALSAAPGVGRVALLARPRPLRPRPLPRPATAQHRPHPQSVGAPPRPPRHRADARRHRHPHTALRRARAPRRRGPARGDARGDRPAATPLHDHHGRAAAAIRVAQRTREQPDRVPRSRVVEVLLRRARPATRRDRARTPAGGRPASPAGPLRGDRRALRRTGPSRPRARAPPGGAGRALRRPGRSGPAAPPPPASAPASPEPPRNSGRRSSNARPRSTPRRATPRTGPPPQRSTISPPPSLSRSRSHHRRW